MSLVSRPIRGQPAPVGKTAGSGAAAVVGTVFKTTIETGDETTVSGFPLIAGFEYNRKGSMHAERLRYLEVTLSEWLFRAIESAEVLTLNPIYFQLRSPLDRRLDELARKHCGNQDKWRIRIDKLQKKCGSKQERKHFVKHLRETMKPITLPTTGSSWTAIS